MKFIEPSQLTSPDAAARQFVEISNAAEVVQDGRVYIELVNGPARGSSKLVVPVVPVVLGSLSD